jgi:glycosyltransferase involved in cell wall biosynthesis
MAPRFIPNKFSQRERVLFLFSDVNASPMLLEIVKAVQQSKSVFKVIVVGGEELDICKALQQQGIFPHLVSKRSKHGLFRMLASISKQVIILRPTTIMASGQYATILGLLPAYLTRVRHRVFIRHHSNYHIKNNMRLGILADRIANRLSTRIVAVSEIVEKILINVEGVKPSKVILIRNGVDLERFGEAIPSREISDLRQKEVIRIGVVSRMTGWKGVQFSVDAFIMLKARYPNTYLDLVGAPADSIGHIKDRLATLDASDYSLSDWHPDILGFLGKLDIFVHVPIGPQDEAFGLVYIEALASRTPSIFTISGVLHELPNPEKYARVVPYEDSKAIFNELVEIIEGAGTNRESVPPEWLRQYSLKTMGENYLSLLIGAK